MMALAEREKGYKIIYYPYYFYVPTTKMRRLQGWQSGVQWHWFKRVGFSVHIPLKMCRVRARTLCRGVSCEKWIHQGVERSPQGGTGGFYFKINLMLKGFTRHTASKHTLHMVRLVSMCVSEGGTVLTRWEWLCGWCPNLVVVSRV